MIDLELFDEGGGGGIEELKKKKLGFYSKNLWPDHFHCFAKKPGTIFSYPTDFPFESNLNTQKSKDLF